MPNIIEIPILWITQDTPESIIPPFTVPAIIYLIPTLPFLNTTLNI
jgi:hypothetical protein